ncbi:MAG: AmmeMemoRadiSam system protein B [Caldilineae bacterium]|nr:AmmeMemoRadiSam system protein B [Anaerolineae bacterium]MCB9153805.1 AmmeMemoRadiSam system protein B [Caldilineae bacterium]
MHTKPNDNPRLRTIDITEFYHQGQPALLLRDPLRLGDNHVVLPRALAPALSLMDGTDDLHELHAELLLRFRMNVPVDVLQQLIEVLDEAFLLDNQRAAEAREHALLAYRAAPFRPPSMAGQSYPAEPRQLAQLLDGYLAAVNGTGPASAAGRGVISPHIDYPRGGPVYAAVWKRAAEMARAADLVILLGTDHYSMGDRITLTRQNYATPYGVLPTDQALVDALATEIGEQAAFAGELRHRGEHSLELVATWLHHMRGGKPVAMAPILTGSFMDFVMGRGDPANDRQLGAFLNVLSSAMAGRNVLVVASGDLAHVGPAFGGNPVDSAGRRGIDDADRGLMAELAAGRADGFFGAIKQVKDRNNVCGVSPFYLMLKLLGNVEGQTVAYDQCPADAGNTSLVSVCGMVFG